MADSSAALWAPLGDALKLILTGSTNQTLSGMQKSVFMNVLAKASRDKEGNLVDKPSLPTVETTEYCVDEKQKKFQTYFYIPHLVTYMLEHFDDWSITDPPLCLDFLNSLTYDSGVPIYTFGSAPGYKAWLDTDEGQKHWKLVCKKIDLKQQLEKVSATAHNNDPLKFEAQNRLKKSIKSKLKKVTKKLENYSSELPDERPIPKPVTEQPWIAPARNLGKEIYMQFPYLSLEQIAEKVYPKLKEIGVRGRGGRVLSAGSIRKHALKGLKSE